MGWLWDWHISIVFELQHLLHINFLLNWSYRNFVFGLIAWTGSNWKHPGKSNNSVVVFVVVVVVFVVEVIVVIIVRKKKWEIRSQQQLCFEFVIVWMKIKKKTTKKKWEIRLQLSLDQNWPHFCLGTSIFWVSNILHTFIIAPLFLFFKNWSEKKLSTVKSIKTTKKKKREKLLTTIITT